MSISLATLGLGGIKGVEIHMPPYWPENTWEYADMEVMPLLKSRLSGNNNLVILGRPAYLYV